MLKRSTILIITLLIICLPTLNSCIPQPQQQVAQAPVVLPEPPELKAIENTLNTDESIVVKKQSLANLKAINHPRVIDILIKVIKDNIETTEIVNVAIENLLVYKEAAVPKVREELWISSNKNIVIEPKYQAIGLQVLISIEKKELLYPELKEFFFNTIKDEEYSTMRNTIVNYLLNNADPATNLPDIITILNIPDVKIVQMAYGKLSELKDPKALPLLGALYRRNPDPEISKAVLTVLNSYDEPGKGKSPIDDISILLDSFASDNVDIHTLSYSGIKKFAYNDKDGLIIKYLSEFKDCSNEIIRSNVIELIPLITAKQYPQGVTPPTFTLPKYAKRAGYCS
jgi:hypothetical protein